MHPFWVGLLWGIGLGIILVPLVGYIIWKYKMTQMRRKIKRLLYNGEILKPIDSKDYNVEMWKDKINNEEESKKIDEIPKMFKKENDSKIDEPEDKR